jgi:hypothetical protein
VNKFITILILFSFTLVAQQKSSDKKGEEKENNEPSSKILTKEEERKANNLSKVKENEKIVLLKFIQAEYVEPAIKKIPILEKKLNKIRDQIAIAKGKARIEKLKKDLLNTQADFAAEKIWISYSNVYKIKLKAKNEKDSIKYSKAKKVLKQLKKKYLTITAKRFPNVESIFHNKYAAQIKKRREASQQ